MWYTFKSVFRIVIKNWTSLLLFEILYKLFSYSILSTVVNNLLIYTLDIAGIPYLSFENIGHILVSPVAMLVILSIVLLITICTFFEIGVLYLYCQRGWENETITLWQMIKDSLKNCRNLLHVKTTMFFGGFLLITSLTVLPFSHYIPGWKGIPEFIMEYIIENKVLLIVFIILVVVLNYIFIRYLFSLLPFFIEKKGLKSSWRESRSVLKENHIRVIGKLILLMVVFFLILLTVMWLAVLGMVIYCKILYSGDDAVNIFRFMFKSWSRVGTVTAGFVGTIWLIAVVTALFHEGRKEECPQKKRKKFSLLVVAKRIIMAVLVIIILMFYSETELGGNFVNYSGTDMRIVAHRAGAAFAPENTIAALNGAIAIGADEAEIDVQQLGDGTLIIMHDSDFKRTVGIKKAVWEAKYSEVKDYDGGSYFSNEFAGEPIPTLEDMLKNAKNKIRLMIELKLTGHEDSTELVNQTLNLIREYDMSHQCSIASMNLDILKRVKELDSRFETVYITPLLFSGQYDEDFIDSYSVETTSVTREMVFTAHFQGKKVYGWTANTEASIEKNMRCHVDGLVTDNPELASFYLEEHGEDLLLNSFIEIYFSK